MNFFFIDLKTQINFMIINGAFFFFSKVLRQFFFCWSNYVNFFLEKIVALIAHNPGVILKKKLSRSPTSYSMWFLLLLNKRRKFFVSFFLYS